MQVVSVTSTAIFLIAIFWVVLVLGLGFAKYLFLPKWLQIVKILIVWIVYGIKVYLICSLLLLFNVLVLKFFQNHQSLFLLFWMKYTNPKKHELLFSSSKKQTTVFQKKKENLSDILHLFTFCSTVANILCFPSASCSVKLLSTQKNFNNTADNKYLLKLSASWII